MKKFLSLFLVLALALGLCVTAFAGTTTDSTKLRLTGNAVSEVVNLKNGQRITAHDDVALRLNVLENPGKAEYSVKLDGQTLEADHSTAQYHVYYLPAEKLNSGTATLSVDELVEIGTAAEMKAFCDRVNAGEAALNAKLTADITLDKSEAWTPIGSYSGTFDGKGHTISGLSVANAAQKAGFIAVAGDGAEIRNLTIADSSFSGSNSRIGAFVGYTEGAITFENCHTAADVSVTGSSGVGGLFGGGNTANAFITMKNCSNRAAVTATAGSNNNGVGGLIGTAPNGANITDSCNLGKVQATGTSAVAVGGLIGASNTSSSKPAQTATLTNVYNTGEISSAATTTQYVGGLLGNATWGCTISHAYGTMTVKFGSGSYGGIVAGYVANTVTVDSIYIELIRGQNQNCKAAIFDSAGLLKSAEKMFNDTEMKNLAKLSKLGDAFAEDVNSINDGYPVLAWQNPTPQVTGLTVRVNGVEKPVELPADGSTDASSPTAVTVEFSYDETSGAMDRIYFDELSEGVELGSGFKDGTVTGALTKLNAGYTGQQIFFYKDPKVQTKSVKALWNDGSATHYYTVSVKRAAQEGYVLAPGSSSNESNPAGANSYNAATGCITGMIKSYAAAPFTFHDLTLFNSGKTSSTTASPAFPTDETGLYYLKDGTTAYFARPGRYWISASVEKDGETYTGEAPFLAVWTKTALDAHLKNAAAVQADEAFKTLPESVQTQFNAIVDRLTAGLSNMSGNVMLTAAGKIAKDGEEATDIQARDFDGKQIFTERLLEGDECALLDLMAIFNTYKTNKQLGQYQAEAYARIAGLNVNSYTDVTTQEQKTLYRQVKQAKWDLLRATDLDGVNAILTSLALDTIDEETVTLGDINGDGKINLTDAALLVQYVNEIITFNDTQLAAGDVNGDGKVNLTDAALLIQYVNEIITSFEN